METPSCPAPATWKLQLLPPTLVGGGFADCWGVAATEMACAGTTEVMFVRPCDHVCEGSLWYSPSLLGS